MAIFRFLAFNAGVFGLLAADADAQTYRDCPLCPQMVTMRPDAVTINDPAAPGGKRRVFVKRAFSLGKYEITRGQFADFVEATAYKTGPCLHRKNGRWQRTPSRH